MTGLSGLVGLLFFEFLRIYKCTTVGKHPVPNNRIGWHVFGLAGLGAIGVILAYQFAQGEFIEGMVLGFSVPSGLKTVLAKESAPRNEGEDRWKEERAKTQGDFQPVSQNNLKRWFIGYFDR